MHPLLQATAHRPWPLPRSPWIMTQTWHDLLFAHWRLAPQILRPLVPAQLPLDTYEGQCWLAVTPFHMSDVRPRGLPALPGFSSFPELNVRTYVKLEDKPGVYFFSLDAGILSAVFAARSFYRLPYYYARMKVQVTPEKVRYHSLRRVPANAEFRGRYRPAGAVQVRARGSLEHWLTERYCLYTTTGRSVFRAEIHHLPWPLQDAEAEIEVNTMAAAAGITLPDMPPLLYFSRRLEVLVWPLRRV
jgi:uncharacterized protein YqjF (DUF2071 family)